jgi:hypothetical protein
MVTVSGGAVKEATALAQLRSVWLAATNASAVLVACEQLQPGPDALISVAPAGRCTSTAGAVPPRSPIVTVTTYVSVAPTATGLGAAFIATTAPPVPPGPPGPLGEEALLVPHAQHAATPRTTAHRRPRLVEGIPIYNLLFDSKLFGRSGGNEHILVFAAFAL